MSPYERTKAYLVKQGYEVGKVEHWNAFAKIRQDLFGVVDLVAMKRDTPMLFIQCTTTGNMSHRLEKTREKGRMIASTGNLYEIWGWAKRGPRGKKKTWTRRCLLVDSYGATHEIDDQTT